MLVRTMPPEGPFSSELSLVLSSANSVPTRRLVDDRLDKYK